MVTESGFVAPPGFGECVERAAAEMCAHRARTRIRRARLKNLCDRRLRDMEFHLDQAAQGLQHLWVNAVACVNVEANHLEGNGCASAQRRKDEQESSAVYSSGQADAYPVAVMNQAKSLDCFGDRLPEVFPEVLSRSIHH